VLGAEQLGAPTAWVAFVLAAGLLVLALVGERGAMQVPGLGRVVQRSMGWIRSMPAALRAVWLGVLTPLLPCGLLWAACAGAAVAGSAWSGAQVMAGFALGSLPLLLLAQHQSVWLGRRFGPRTLAVLQRGTMLVAAGILVWRGFAGLDGGCCH
jgi:sulfite exporter TauE/SafE